MKKYILPILLFITFIPFYVNALEGRVSFYSNTLHLNYIDENGEFIKNASFEVRNIEDNNILTITDDGTGIYEFPLNINSLYPDSQLYETVLSFFDEYHRNIITELMSDLKYVDANTYNEYIKDLETDYIIQMITTAKYGYDGWGLFGHLPIKMVEKDTDNPIILYDNISFSLRKTNGKFDLSMNVSGILYYISIADDLVNVHQQRFKEDINNNTYSSYSETSEEFNSNYSALKTYGFYNKSCLEDGIEGEPLYINNCGIETIYKEKQTDEIDYKIETKTDGNGTLTSEKERANGGEVIKFTVEPKEGYVLGSVKVTDSEGNTIVFTENTFTMPNADVLIEATFIKAENLSEEENKEEPKEEPKQEDKKEEPVVEQEPEDNPDTITSNIMEITILLTILFGLIITSTYCKFKLHRRTR